MKDGIYQIVNKDTNLVLTISDNAAHGSCLKLLKFQRMESEFCVTQAAHGEGYHSLTVERDGTILSARILDSRALPVAASGRPGTVQLIPVSHTLQWFMISNHGRSQYVGVERCNLVLTNRDAPCTVWVFQFQRPLPDTEPSKDPKVACACPKAETSSQLMKITAQLEALQLANKRQQQFNNGIISVLSNQQRIMQKMLPGPPRSNPRCITGPQFEEVIPDECDCDSSDDTDHCADPTCTPKTLKNRAMNRKCARPQKDQKGRKGPEVYIC